MLALLYSAATVLVTLLRSPDLALRLVTVYLVREGTRAKEVFNENVLVMKDYICDWSRRSHITWLNIQIVPVFQVYGVQALRKQKNQVTVIFKSSLSWIGSTICNAPEASDPNRILYGSLTIGIKNNKITNKQKNKKKQGLLLCKAKYNSTSPLLCAQ